MIKLDYRLGFSIDKLEKRKRICGVGVYFSEPNSLLSDVNACDYNYSLEVISKLKDLIKNKISEFEWGGGERSWFTSCNNKTVVSDNFGWSPDLVISTKELLTLMLLRMSMMEDWSRNELLSHIQSIFENLQNDIKINREKGINIYDYFHTEQNRLFRFILSEMEFNLSPIFFIEKIYFNKRYFKEDLNLENLF